MRTSKCIIGSFLCLFLSGIVINPVQAEDVMFYLENVSYNQETRQLSVQWNVYNVLDQSMASSSNHSIIAERIPTGQLHGFTFYVRVSKNSQSKIDTVIANRNQYTIVLEEDIQKDDAVTIAAGIQNLPHGFTDITEAVNQLINVSPNLGQAIVSKAEYSELIPLAQAIRRVPIGIVEFIKKGGLINYLLGLIFLVGIAAIPFYIRSIFGNKFIHVNYLDRWVNFVSRHNYDSLLALIHQDRAAREDADIVPRVIQLTEAAVQNEMVPGELILSSRQLERKKEVIYANVREEIQKIGKGKIRGGARLKSLNLQLPGIDFFWNVAIISPMLGLLGTVYGISGTFGQVAAKTGIEPIATGHEVENSVIGHFAGGINLALSTTVAGLSVGILFMLFYYMFYMRCRGIENRLSKIAEIIISKYLGYITIHEGKVYRS